MGCASVYWGYDLGDMLDDHTFKSLLPESRREWLGEEWGEELARRLGWREEPFPTGCPHHDYPKPPEEYRAAMAAFRETPEYKAWLDNRQAMRGIIQEVPVELDVHDCGDTLYYTARVKASVLSVSHGSQKLPPLKIGVEWAERLKRFMELLELPISGDGPGWYLNCSCGR